LLADIKELYKTVGKSWKEMSLRKNYLWGRYCSCTK